MDPVFSPYRYHPTFGPMEEPSPSPTQQNMALRIVRAIEEGMPIKFATDPKKIGDLFRKYSVAQSSKYPEPASLYPGKDIQSADLSKIVLKEMEQIRNTVLMIDKRTITPDDQLKIDQFRRQVDQFKACLEGTATQPIAQHQPRTYLTVAEVKRAITNPLRPFFDSERLQGSFAAAFTGGIYSITVVGIVVAGLAAGAASLAVLLPVTLGVAGLGIAVVAAIAISATIYHHLRRKANETAFAAASTPEQILPLFKKLSPEAQARFFVELGPEFRNKLCAQYKGLLAETDMQEMADIVNVLHGPFTPSVSKEDQDLAFRTLWEPSRKLGWKLAAFRSELQKFLS